MALALHVPAREDPTIFCARMTINVLHIFYPLTVLAKRGGNPKHTFLGVSTTEQNGTCF